MVCLFLYQGTALGGDFTADVIELDFTPGAMVYSWRDVMLKVYQLILFSLNLRWLYKVTCTCLQMVKNLFKNFCLVGRVI